MAPPASAARALHDIIETVEGRIGPSHRNAYKAWWSVANAEITSSEFAQFHAEVLHLFSEVAVGVRALTSKQQERYASYLPKWWDSLVRPLNTWAQDGLSITDETSLHVLAGLADLMEARAEATGPKNPQAPEVLHRAVLLLIAEVEQDLDLPATVRDQILADLRHVLWLLERVDTFGLDHAVAEAERVTGKIVVAASTTRSERLRKAAIGMVAALAMVATAATSVETITTSVRHTFGISADAHKSATGGEDLVQNVVVEIYDACVTKELTATPAEHSDDTVDAEVIEDEDEEANG